jgi:biopolymer transport protein ExbB
VEQIQASFSGIVIVLSVVGVFNMELLNGCGSNFEGGVNTGHPLQGNYLAMMYKGGDNSINGLVLWLSYFQLKIL